MHPLTVIRAMCIAVGLAVASCAAISQSYPARPIRMVVPFPPGSGTDVAARTLGQYLSTSLGQPVVVDNKPGAGGSIGAMDVVRAAPDGYTLLFGSSSTLAANVSLLKNMPYDPTKDLSAVAGVADSVTALIVKSDFPAKTLPEFIAYVKSRPGKINGGYGSSSTQMAVALLNKHAGLDVVGVPYKGTPLAVTDLLAGTIDFTFADLGNIMPHVRAGTVRGIGLTTPKRSAMVPEWPPMADTLSGFDDITGWIAIAGPPGLPKDIAEKIAAAVATGLQQADVRSKLALFGLSPMPMNPDQLKAFIASEIPKWGRMAKEAKIEPQ